MKTLGHIALLVLALSLIGCGNKEPAAPSGDTGVPTTEQPTTDSQGANSDGAKSATTDADKTETKADSAKSPAEDLKPANFKPEQLAGVFRAVLTDDQVSEAAAHGMDFKSNWPIITLGKDGSWIMGTENGGPDQAKGHFTVSASQLIMVPEEVGGTALSAEEGKKGTRVFDVTDSGKTIKFTAPNGAGSMEYKKKG